MRIASALLVMVSLGACADEPFRCPEPRVSLRNPNTLVCEAFHVPSTVCPDESDPPTWATCNACAQVTTQADCLAAPGCRAAYDSCYLLDEPCLGGRVYVGCVGVDRAGPEPGACEDLDADGCSSRDDCAAWMRHHPTCNQMPDEPRPTFHQPQNGTCVLVFSSCRVEPTTPVELPPAAT
ncbi:MAG TPA: hypothetical protein VM261_31925 [Kofleriaceae bacterium]|nr:hypothetical protein [Kofleriaceae bacterium]